MRRLAQAGRLLIAASGACAWLALAGALLPSLDPLASFMPVFGLLALLGGAAAWRGGRMTALWTAAALAPFLFSVLPEFLREIPAAQAASPGVRIVTHNVWVDNGDPASTAQIILDARPDVVMLQEVDGTFRPMTEALQQVLPHATGCAPGCDFIILSRWPIGRRDYFLKDTAGRAFGPPLPWAEIRPPGMRPFIVATTHYPQPLPAARQARTRAQVAAALTLTDMRSLVLAGDMNLTPWTAAMRDQDSAFAPLIRQTRALASWRRPLPFMPIDHLYAGPDWGLVEAQRLPGRGSDHYPLLVVLGRR